MLFEHGTTDDRLTIERLDADRFRALEDAFLILAQRLRQKGIHLIVVGYPDKSMLYPERLPAQAPTIARGGNYDTLRQFLAGQSALTFIDAEVILNREKSQTDEPLFYKTDIHDNLVGQIPVVKAIVDKIAQIEGRTNIKWHEQLDLKRVDWGMGSEGRFLSLLSPVHERITYAAAGHAIGQTVPDGHWNVPDPRAVDGVGDGNGLPFDFEFHSAPQLCDKRLPGVVLFGISFSDPVLDCGPVSVFLLHSPVADSDRPTTTSASPHI